MLTCKDFLIWLNDYIDDSATGDVRQQVEEHISRCPNCWVVYDTTKKTIQVFKGQEAQDIPSDVHERLMNAIEKRMSEAH